MRACVKACVRGAAGVHVPALRTPGGSPPSPYSSLLLISLLNLPRRTPTAEPAHHSAVFHDNGRWWTIARALWRTYAPSVEHIESFELLLEQGGAKIRDCRTSSGVFHAGMDSQHWCIDSAAYEEYASSVLTAIVERVERGRRGRWTHDV